MARPFQFLNLGILAYVGDSKALAQVSLGDSTLKDTGRRAFALWRRLPGEAAYWNRCWSRATGCGTASSGGTSRASRVRAYLYRTKFIEVLPSYHTRTISLIRGAENANLGRHASSPRITRLPH